MSVNKPRTISKSKKKIGEVFSGFNKQGKNLPNLIEDTYIDDSEIFTTVKKVIKENKDALKRLSDK